MIVTKTELISIGFEEQQIFVFDSPIIMVNNVIMKAEVYKYQTLDHMKMDTFIQDIIACGFIFICNTQKDYVFDNSGSLILRIFNF